MPYGLCSASLSSKKLEPYSEMAELTQEVCIYTCIQ